MIVSPLLVSRPEDDAEGKDKAAMNRRTPGASQGHMTANTRGSVWSARALAPLFRFCNHSSFENP
jgi:hypothetical protein